MSRSGYYDDCDGWELIRWRGAVVSAIRGQRGQAFLRELLAALDAMPKKRLVANALLSGDEVCAIGSLGIRRGVDMSSLDPYDRESVARTFGIAEALAAEIAFVNDDYFCTRDTPERRWEGVRAWVVEQIAPRDAGP